MKIYTFNQRIENLFKSYFSYFSKSFEVNDTWQQYEIFFSDLKLATGFSAASLKAKNIKDLSIAGYGRDFKVDLAIKDITLF